MVGAARAGVARDPHDGHAPVTIGENRSTSSAGCGRTRYERQQTLIWLGVFVSLKISERRRRARFYVTTGGEEEKLTSTALQRAFCWGLP